MNRYARLARYAVLICFSLVSIFPFYWMVLTALTKTEWVTSPTMLPIPLYLEAFERILFFYPFARWVLNTTINATAATLGSIFFASLAAFSFACLRWRCRELIFYVLLTTMMLSGFLLIIPRYLLVVRIGWMDTYWGIFIPGWFSIFSVFLLRQYYFAIPTEILNAARIDGANLWQIYWRIILPNSKMVLAALFIIMFLGQWNSLFWPLLIVKSQNMETLAVGIAGLGGTFVVDYSQIMAGSILSLIPILVIFALFGRHISSGLKMKISF